MIPLSVFVSYVVLLVSANELWNNDDEYDILRSIEYSAHDILTFRGAHGPQQPPPVEVCYPLLGCFHKNGTFKHVKWLPESPEQIGTKFALYTRLNPDIPVYLDYQNVDTLRNQYFDPKKPTKIICHGFTQSSQSTGIAGMKDAILKMEDANIILVDWKKGAALPFYLTAAVNTEVVGRQVALLVSLLKTNERLDEKHVHIIGFSLGSHLAGFAGKRLRDEMGIMLGRITGLDPASPMFEESDDSVHLSWKDAAYVDVIHTSAGGSYFNGDLGMAAPIGHSDFYPNGGYSQPGCGKLVCSHRRAMELFIHSILSTCKFRAYPCEGDYGEFQSGNCFSCENGCNRMGYHSQLHDGVKRKFYLLTQDSHPFCGTGVQVTLESSAKQSTTYGQVQVALVGKDLEDTIVLTKSKDHEIHAGSHLKGMVAAHEAVFPVKQVKVTYHKYKGWFTDGNHEWNIDGLTVADEAGTVKFRYCSPNTTLTSGEVLVLHQLEC